VYYMHYLLQVIVKWRPLKSEEGVTAIEYALIAGITVLAIVAGVTVVATSLTNIFSNLARDWPAR
jgi:Flp pilus assembly pilin Flp